MTWWQLETSESQIIWHNMKHPHSIKHVRNSLSKFNSLYQRVFFKTDAYMCCTLIQTNLIHQTFAWRSWVFNVPLGCWILNDRMFCLGGQVSAIGWLSHLTWSWSVSALTQLWAYPLVDGLRTQLPNSTQLINDLTDRQTWTDKSNSPGCPLLYKIIVI